MAETERSNLPIAEEPEFTTEIPAIRPDDPVHYAQMNAMLESLLGNDVFLQRLENKMIENSLIAHVLDCENPQMVLGADQAPVITGLIDGVKEDVTQLYSEIRMKSAVLTGTCELREVKSGSISNFETDVEISSLNGYQSDIKKIICVEYAGCYCSDKSGIVLRINENILRIFGNIKGSFNIICQILYTTT